MFQPVEVAFPFLGFQSVFLMYTLKVVVVASYIAAGPVDNQWYPGSSPSKAVVMVGIFTNPHSLMSTSVYTPYVPKLIQLVVVLPVDPAQTLAQDSSPTPFSPLTTCTWVIFAVSLFFRSSISSLAFFTSALVSAKLIVSSEIFSVSWVTSAFKDTMLCIDE